MDETELLLNIIDILKAMAEAVGYMEVFARRNLGPMLGII